MATARMRGNGTGEGRRWGMRQNGTRSAGREGTENPTKAGNLGLKPGLRAQCEAVTELYLTKRLIRPDDGNWVHIIDNDRSRFPRANRIDSRCVPVGQILPLGRSCAAPRFRASGGSAPR